MPHVLYDVVGDDLILIILEELKDKKISSSEAFEKIREILQINFELSSATKNVHNAVIKVSEEVTFPTALQNGT